MDWIGKNADGEKFGVRQIDEGERCLECWFMGLPPSLVKLPLLYFDLLFSLKSNMRGGKVTEKNSKPHSSYPCSTPESKAPFNF